MFCLDYLFTKVIFLNINSDDKDLIDSDNEEKMAIPTKVPKSKKDRKKRKEEELEEAQRELERLNDGENDLETVNDTNKTMEENESKPQKNKTKASKKDKKVLTKFNVLYHVRGNFDVSFKFPITQIVYLIAEKETVI